MRFSFTDDQRLFADGLGDLLSAKCTPAHVRDVWELGAGHDAALWSQLDGMGVLSLLVPEQLGGLGGSLVDAVLLFQQLGRHAVPGPVVEHMLAAPVLAAARISHAIATVWLDGPYVPHAGVAGVVLTGEGAVTGFDTHEVDAIDGGRRLFTVAGGTSTPIEVPAPFADRLALAAAAVLVGLADRMIEMAADYARQRHQFGKPIGSFQAVKHLLADALLQVEFAKAPLHRAAWSLSTDAPTAARDVSMAKALANDAARRTSRATMQVHGAIGYTWECDLHLWMKKAWALERAYGDTRFHRRRVADAVLDRDRRRDPAMF
jgi:alkylation response protein AidB-like acyl-CoA dehydrogenase